MIVEVSAGLALVDAAVKVGGPIASAVLTLIQGHEAAPDEVRQKAADAKDRLASSSEEQDAAYDQARRSTSAGQTP